MKQVTKKDEIAPRLYDLYAIIKDPLTPFRSEFPLGTAFVRVDNATPRSCFYFEGNLYDAVNLKTFAERAQCAAGRAAVDYPTVAKGWFSQEEIEENFVHVGALGPGMVMTLTSQGVAFLQAQLGSEGIGIHLSDVYPEQTFLFDGERYAYRACDAAAAESLFLKSVIEKLGSVNAAICAFSRLGYVRESSAGPGSAVEPSEPRF